MSVARLKVDRVALVTAGKAVLADLESEIEKVTEEIAAYDWRPQAREDLEALTTLLNGLSGSAEDESEYGYALQKVRNRMPKDLERKKRSLQGSRQHLEDFLGLLELNKDEQITVSTSDDHVLNIMRRARKLGQGQPAEV